jgi:hypothetical protein
VIKTALLLAILLTGCVHRIAFAGEFYLAKFETIQRSESFSYWQIKQSDKCMGLIDLRPDGTVDTGYAFAEYSELVTDPDFIYLGDSVNAVIPDIGDVLGVDFPSPTKVRGLIYLILTTLNNDAVCSPALPDTKGNIDIFMSGKKIHSRKIDPATSPEWVNIRKQMRKDYRKVSKKNKILARKMLQVWKEKHGVTDTDQFIPDDMEKVTPLPHNTTLTESFDQVDSGTVGPDLTWIEIAQSTPGSATVSNQLVTSSSFSNSSVGHTDVLSSSDNYSSIDVISETAGCTANVIVRWDGGDTSASYYVAEVEDGSTTLKIYSCDVNTWSTILNTTITAPSYTFNLKLTVDGTSLEAFIDDVSVGTVTDSDHTVGIQCGVGSFDNSFSSPTLTMDNFESGDMAEDAPAVTFTIYNALISNANIA